MFRPRVQAICKQIMLAVTQSKILSRPAIWVPAGLDSQVIHPNPSDAMLC